MEFVHKSVLLNETIQSLNIKPNGIYVDCTAGGGGHSSEILKRLTTGKLVAVDQDPDAIKTLNERFKGEEKIIIVNDNFANLSEILSSLGIESADGIMADLGVSSYQLDNAQRGFSYHTDAPLDMRMSKKGTSAADLVNNLDERSLADIIFRYSEEKFSRQIAKNIVKHRQIKPIETTLELAEIVKQSVPQSVRRVGHPARKTFQALRIEVNGELEKLKGTIDDMFQSLNIGGRLSVITFHSLEDRIVKQNFLKHCEGCTCPPEFPICVCGKTPEGRLPFKFKKPSQKEIDENPRSRSAVLRTIERLK